MVENWHIHPKTVINLENFKISLPAKMGNFEKIRGA